MNPGTSRGAGSRRRGIQLRALTVGRQKRVTRHANPRYQTRPKDIHLENLEREHTDRESQARRDV